MSDISVETDIARQDEEIEALSSIYGEDFLLVNETGRFFDIRIRHEENSWWSMTLQILFLQNYPSKVPPVYEVHGTWLADCDELEIRDKLYSLYRHDELVVFQWVEATREFMNEKALEYASETTEQRQEHLVNLNENIPDDDFQISNSGSKDLSPTVKPQVAGTDSCYEQGLTYFTAQDLPEVLHGEPFTDRKSTFQAHLAKVASEQQMEDVVSLLKNTRKIANATHNIVAYRIRKKDSEVIIQDFDEDGEHHAGSRLLHLLQLLNVQNYVVVVSRWYGGILLGPDRFKHINNCARNLLKTARVIPDNSTKHTQHNKEIKNKRKMKK